MAKKSAKGKNTKRQSEDTTVSTDAIEDAVIVEETATTDAEEVVTDAADGLVADTTEMVEEAQESVETDTVLDDPLPETPDDVPASDATPEPEPTAETADAAPPPAQTTVVEKRGGFAPLLLGGLIAGGLGYGAHWMQTGSGGDSISDALASQSDAIAALQQTVDGLPPVPELPDLAPVTSAIEGLTSDVAGISDRLDQEVGGIGETLSGVEERLTAVEKQPSADGTLQETALAAYEREMEALRSQIAEQREAYESEMATLSATIAEQQQALDGMTQDAQARLDAALSEAEAVETAATRRTALVQIQSALETGSEFAQAASDFNSASDTPLPESISAVSDGVATLAALQTEFPALARSALATARADGATGTEDTGLSGFLRNQFDVRSVTPQEGDGVDAVLSRAEAALKSGSLPDALTELEALPETALAPLADWLSAAQARVSASDALITLIQENAN